MDVVIDTAGVREIERSDCYRDVIRSLFGSCDLRVDRSVALRNQLLMGRIGDLTVTISRSSSGLSVFRTQSNIRRCGRESLDVLHVRAGRCTIVQGGQEVRLAPGEAVLVLSTWPYEIHKPRQTGVVEILQASIPLGRLRQRALRPEMLMARRFPDGSNFTTMAETMVPIVTNAPADLVRRVADGLVSLLEAMLHKLMLEQPEQISSSAMLSLHRAKTFVLENIQDTMLGREAIAQATGMSTRHLHRLFSENGETPNEFIRKIRLDRAAAMLADPALAGLSICEVASRAGYGDQSQFCRHFKERFGATARQIKTGKKR